METARLITLHIRMVAKCNIPHFPKLLMKLDLEIWHKQIAALQDFWNYYGYPQINPYSCFVPINFSSFIDS